MAETEGYQLFQQVLPECNEPSQAICCAFFRRKRVRGSFGPVIKPLSFRGRSPQWPPGQSETTGVERRSNRRPSVANPTRPSVIVATQFPFAIASPLNPARFSFQ